MISPSTRRPALLRAAAAALTFLSAPAFPTAASSNKEPSAPISYDAASMELDVKTGMYHLKEVIITYGKMTVRADRALATGKDFKKSRWTFDGNVRINAVPRGNLRSDQAVVEFEDSQLKRATATGNPAEFDQTGDDANVVARGHADEIVYEVSAATVRLSNDAWVNDGRNDIRAPVITYSLREEHVEATTSPGTERVHVTISPNEAPKGDGAGTNKPKSTQPDSGKAQPSPPQSAVPTAAQSPATVASQQTSAQLSPQPPSPR
jgi:lipopolysaccharide transport protein LptA